MDSVPPPPDRDVKGVERRRNGASQILGEMQLCFLMVLTLANWSCLAQWKRILGLVFGCRTAVAEIPTFFVTFIQVLASQVRCWDAVEGGLFETAEEGAEKWLVGLLGKFKDGVREVLGEKGEVWEELGKLEAVLKEGLGWEVLEKEDVLKRGMVELDDGERVELEMEGADEEEEKGEWAPVIVNLGQPESG